MAKYRMVELKIPWDRSSYAATWSKTTAKSVARKLRPLIGKKVVLYGGGGWDKAICRLKNIRMYKSPPYQRGGKMRKNEYYVDADLKILEIENDWLGGRKEFSPHLGSWKIAKLVKE